MTDSATGTDWTNTELDLIVADYFNMLHSELAGVGYNKSEHRRALMRLINRNDGSIEFKHQNLSAVLQELGQPWIAGYKPRANYQGAIIDAVGRHLSNRPDALESAFIQPSIVNSDGIVVPPPVHVPKPPDQPTELVRLLRKFNPADRDHRNRKLGQAGEQFIFDFERRQLERDNRRDLARKVRWVAQEDGDGAGYDILSFTSDGTERLLEVKTTCGAERTPFYLTRNELALADERPAEFRLVRVFQFATSPRLFNLVPPLRAQLTLDAIAYRASL